MRQDLVFLDCHLDFIVQKPLLNHTNDEKMGSSLVVNVKKKRRKDASKPHKHYAHIYVVPFYLEVRPRITPILLCSKAEDENTKYNFSGGYTMVT